MKEDEDSRHRVTDQVPGGSLAIQGVLWVLLFLLLKSSPEEQPHLPLPDGGLSFACCKAQPMQIRRGADFGAAKLVVCKRLWERAGAASGAVQV